MEKKDYTRFIQKITHREKQNDGSYLTVVKDYMTVDGRVQQFTDIHKEQGMKFKFSRTFEKDKEGNIICHAKICSQLFGVAEASAGAYGRTLVDKSNPYENAETSAYGRCLGFLGLGLMGSGIASAEEVQDAMERQKEPKKPKPKEKDEKITESQVKFIHKLAGDLGLTEDGYNSILDVNFGVSTSHSLTKQQASKLIDILKGYTPNAG